MAEHRVLVIEDDAGARDAFGCLLAEEGFEVRTAANGSSAVACAREFGPDTVICDFSLPDTDGLQMLRALQALRPGIFFIMLTAGCGDEEAERALRREADLFLDKPIDFPRFREELQRIRRSAQHPLPAINTFN